MKSIFDRTDFPFLADLEANWHIFRDECLGVADHFLPCLQESSYVDGEWATFLLHSGGEPVAEAVDRCPGSLRLLRQYVPNRAATAGFMCLPPGAVLKPHNDRKTQVMRLHLGLIVPEGDLGFRVREARIRWRAGEAFAFPDRFMHAAWNRSDGPRYVLLCDFRWPEATGAD